MGIECLSQGANYVTFIDKEKRVISRINYNLINLYVHLKRYKLLDVNLFFLLRNPYLHKDIYLKYDIIFIDPPFYKGFVSPTIDLLIKFKWIKLGSLVYLEYEKGITDLFIPYNWFLLKNKNKKKTIHKLFLIIL